MSNVFSNGVTLRPIIGVSFHFVPHKAFFGSLIFSLFHLLFTIAVCLFQFSSLRTAFLCSIFVVVVVEVFFVVCLILSVCLHNTLLLFFLLSVLI